MNKNNINDDCRIYFCVNAMWLNIFYIIMIPVRLISVIDSNGVLISPSTRQLTGNGDVICTCTGDHVSVIRIRQCKAKEGDKQKM